ncbi:hypothetical protein SLS58_005138 [Diplodia intermedia]|uniref:RNase H type-1 domain-containing protein n=1 Tax=Diplodia intermedia TaxID=856260 RepID=A0ABR3TRH3_9PEZI
MVQASHPLFKQGCTGVSRNRIFNGDQAFNGEEALETFEDVQQLCHKAVAPCPGPPCPDCGAPALHTDSVMIAVDGACRSNGRPDATAACAVFFTSNSIYNETHIITANGPYAPTSQRTELVGGIKGLEAAKRLATTLDGELKQVVIKTDSAYLFRGATEWIAKWEAREWKNAKGGPVVNQDLFRQLEVRIVELESMGVLVQFFQVPRAQNRQADAAANEALDAAEKPTHTVASALEAPQGEKVEEREQTTDAAPFFVAISLAGDPRFDHYYRYLAALFYHRARIVRANDPSAACAYLAAAPPTAVLVTDAGITETHEGSVLNRLKEYVSNGGTVIFCGLFSIYVQPDKLSALFRTHFGLPWAGGDRARATFRLNPDAAAALPSLTSLPFEYDVEALLLKGVGRHAALFLPEGGEYWTQTAAAWARVGRGWVGYLGDDGSEDATDDLKPISLKAKRNPQKFDIMITFICTLFLLNSVIITPTAQSFQPCPLLGPFFPAARIDPSSAVLQDSLSSFTELLDKYVQAGDGDFGPITPNTTSFSITLFAGSSSGPSSNQSNPSFYEYHHTAPATSNKSGEVNADSQYPVGALTQLFTVYALLAGNGSQVWSKPITEFLPELLRIQNGSSAADPLSLVNWEEVTLGALASHMAGVGRDSFQLLASAMERTTAQPFSTILQTRILHPLGMTRTALLRADDTHTFGTGLPPAVGEPASLSLISTPHDLSLAGAAMLSSTLLPPGATRRWLSPASATSNLRNAVGRPWEIYHFGTDATDPVVDVYTKTGSIGAYSAYFGLAPDHDVGFSILAYDDGDEEEGGGAAPDLNAYADVALEALLAVAALGRKQAGALLAGEYRCADAANANSSSSLVLGETGDADPGLAVESFVVDGADWRARTAALMAVERPADLDFRLYPTNLRAAAADGGLSVVLKSFRGDSEAHVKDVDS